MRRWAGVAAVILALAAWLRVGPLPPGLLDLQQGRSTAIVDRHGDLLYEARGADGSRSVSLRADELPSSLVDATVAAEDHRFWRHPGVDPIALVRAAIRDLRSRRVVEGGSTITQQVAKLLLARASGPQRRGIAAKIRETVIALRLEHRLTKREILALYLNLASYGNQLVGAERASRAYFGRGVALLTPAQAAFLASLPQRPSTYNPYRDPARARSRQEHVLVQMALLKLLTPDALRMALDEHLALEHSPAEFVAGHFVERVVAAGGPARGETIETTLDLELQRTVQGIIRAARPTLDRYGAHNVAAVVLDNRSGEWLAWEGSGDYADAAHGGTIDGAISPRQPGSALKPFTYALAFERGESPATVLADVPSYFPTAQDGILYSPRNYDNHYRGPLLARRALAGSENIAAVSLASRVGVPNLVRFLREAGLTTFDKTGAYYGLGITLGDAEVRLDQLVAAYASFARGGVAVVPTMIRRQPGASADGPRLVSERTAFWISDILSDNDARAFAFGRGSSLEFPFPVAAKTGTSEGYHDNWTIGYTQAVTVGVWVGNFDRRPLVGSSGVSGAGPIFHAIMLAAQQRATGSVMETLPPTTARPVGTARRRICALSGLDATPSCPNQIDEWLPADAPVHACSWHRATPRGVAVDWPSEYRAWAQQEGRLDPLASSAPARDVAFRVVSPPDGAVYLIDPTLRREFQSVSLRASAAGRDAIEWRVDDRTIARGTRDDRVDWPLAPGRHVVTAIDARGRRAASVIVVK